MDLLSILVHLVTRSASVALHGIGNGLAKYIGSSLSNDPSARAITSSSNESMVMANDVSQLLNEGRDMSPSISVVIPCYNEESSIQSAIESALDGSSVVEVIVADGGSKDRTVDVINSIKDARVRLLVGATSRSSAQNLGASAAVGHVLVFLHADSVLPPSFDKHIYSALRGEQDTALTK
jgi:cellulose synthase/poly-beta-1,6-N-acetylglucosamine synthase-like glycosyltransferase